MAQELPADLEIELIFLDDGNSVGHLIPSDDSRIRYFHTEGKMKLGQKRNRLAELSKGSVLLNWDDDDFFATDRVSRQIKFHQSANKAVSGYGFGFFNNSGLQQFNRYQIPEPYVLDVSLCYDKSYWKINNFSNLEHTEADLHFQCVAIDQNQLARNNDDSNPVIVASTHQHNTSPRDRLYNLASWTAVTNPIL